MKMHVLRALAVIGTLALAGCPPLDEGGVEGDLPVTGPDAGACDACPGGLCDPATGECTGCATDGDCDQGVCDPSQNLCVQCLDDGDCAEGFCEPGSSVCVQCLEDAQCETGVCDPESEQCVECTGDDDCGSGVCNLATHGCVGCADAGDCDDGDPCTTDTCAESECRNEAAFGCGVLADGDEDGVADEADNCPDEANAGQEDGDEDGAGDACDPCPLDAADDTDGDGACDSDDPCPLDIADDTDGDGACDSDDPCPLDIADDTDGDGACDSDDPCPLDVADDSDGDQVCDSDDVCVGADASGDLDGDGRCNDVDPWTIIGTVRRVDGQPIPSARVSTNAGAITFTDAGGHYVLPEVAIPAGGVVVVGYYRQGYAPFHRRVQLAGRDGVSASDVILKSPEAYAWWQSPTADVVIEEEDVHLQIPAGALLREDGSPLAEPYTVSLITGDPTDSVDALAMPGDYMAEDGGLTMLESWIFADITVEESQGGRKVHGVDPALPLTVELRLPEALQNAVATGTSLPWWSFDTTTALWMRESEVEIVDIAGVQWARAQLTHLSWWNVDEPIAQHGCICVDVVDGDGAPAEGLQVVASGATYNGTSSAVTTDDAGRACVTIQNSVVEAHAVNLEVELGTARIPHADNPIATPAVQASCIRNQGCPELCEVLDTPIVAAFGGTVQGTATLRSGAPADGLLVSTTFGNSTTTDALGAYALPVVLDADFNVFALGHTSPDLLATEAEPTVTYDLQLSNVPPMLVEVYANGELLGDPGMVELMFEVEDLDAPVDFEVVAIDLDGDPITYAWEGLCYDQQQQPITKACEPPDAAITTCEGPGSAGVPGSIYCHYIISLDDGYVDDPVQAYLMVRQKGGTAQ